MKATLKKKRTGKAGGSDPIAARVGAEHGVSESYVLKAHKTRLIVDEIDSNNPGFKKLYLKGDKKSVAKVSKLVNPRFWKSPAAGMFGRKEILDHLDENPTSDFPATISAATKGNESLANSAAATIMTMVRSGEIFQWGPYLSISQEDLEFIKR